MFTCVCPRSLVFCIASFAHFALLLEAIRVESGSSGEFDQEVARVNGVALDWNFVCNGYIKGKYRPRKGLGHTKKDFIGKDDCMKSCQKFANCNFITYDGGSGKCWLESLPQAMPSPDCMDITSAWSYWRGDPSATSGPSLMGVALATDNYMPLGWHLFCHGYVKDKHKRTGFGQTSQKFLGKVGCMEACSQQVGCNFVTYDTLRGQCWMEHVLNMPDHCDANDAGWSYAKNDEDELWLLELSGSLDGWHFLCTGYISGKHKGRFGYGQADDLFLGHDGCKTVCDSKDGCNFVTYDAWTGTCWLEYIPNRPEEGCDDNSAGWSYWRGHIDEELKSSISADGDDFDWESMLSELGDAQNWTDIDLDDE